MKNIILAIILLTSLNGCITGTHIAAVSGIENLHREDYTILNEDKSSSRANKFWILFLPFGGKSEEKREAQCFKRMLSKNKADGVLAAKYTHRKLTIPLVLFTYTLKTTTLEGKPYVLKIDSVKK